jgi:hypothetical protein
VTGALLLFGFQVFLAAGFIPTGSTISLRASDFRWFNSNPPGPATAGPTAWVLPVPGDPATGGKLAVDDAVSVASYDLGALSFTATFVNGTITQGKPTAFADELVVFAASDITTYKGFEFGVRLGLTDGMVYGYWQYPQAGGGVVFKEQPLFPNDGRAHTYMLSLSGSTISYSVDGQRVIVAVYPTLPPRAFHVITTAHRESAGWSASGLALSVADVTVRQPLL